MIKKISILAVVLLSIVVHKIYWKQREDYEKNLSFHLQLACHRMIQKEFGQHASDIHTKNVGYHEIHEINSIFNIYNDLYFMKVRSSATIYFNDHAPQDLYCVAMIEPHWSEINKDTKVKFLFRLPNYLPFKDNGSEYNLEDRELTFKQVENLTGLKFRLFYKSPLKKPELIDEIFQLME